MYTYVSIIVKSKNRRSNHLKLVSTYFFGIIITISDLKIKLYYYHLLLETMAKSITFLVPFLTYPI